MDSIERNILTERQFEHSSQPQAIGGESPPIFGLGPSRRTFSKRRLPESSTGSQPSAEKSGTKTKANAADLIDRMVNVMTKEDIREIGGDIALRSEAVAIKELVRMLA